ncbi:beta-lactamase family protein [Flammeovirga sp. MY04]|uniref:serine hydrolase domain-containing protein n=1 Tax=Flammeovirga sp. MY04 TaxID=1191459 RepID=UPI0008060D84|nr:serine hydrolase domain-containing protein [Flammeovirga sp. MY04]ANQ51644.1 beta-lactamase family protein [Flammeovirga sp. MY04]
MHPTKNTNQFFLLLLLFPIQLWAQDISLAIDSLVSKYQREYQIPAMAVGVVQSDTCYFGIEGVVRIEKNQKVRLSDKFHLGSNTKAITSFIAFKMIESDEISLNTKFFDICSDLKDEISAEYQEITLGDLLSHQAGIQPYTSGLEYEKLPTLNGSISDKRKQFSEFVLNEESVAKGTYSNAGYILASLMLEKAAHLSFEKLVDKHMKALDLDYFIGFPNKQNQKYPWGHWEENQQLISLSPTHFYKLEDYTLAAGDVSMNIENYARLVQLHLNGLMGEDNYLTSDSYKKMHYGIDNYAYGWGNMKTKTSKISFHDGSAGTYFCHTILVPSRSSAIIVMANSATEEHQKAVYELRDELIRVSGELLE